MRHAREPRNGLGVFLGEKQRLDRALKWEERRERPSSRESSLCNCMGARTARCLQFTIKCKKSVRDKAE